MDGAITYDSHYLINHVTFGLRTAFMLSLPMLIAAIAVGVVIALFQAATQIQEQSLSFGPKIVATFLAVLMTGPYCATVIVKFMVATIMSIPFLRVK